LRHGRGSTRNLHGGYQGRDGEAAHASLVSFFLFSLGLFRQPNLKTMNYVGLDVSKDTFHADFGVGRVEIFENSDA
jgi:hypothetical protein